MSPMYRINFRREAFRQQRDAARARVIGLGVWLTYAGMVAVVLGLYGLNLASLADRNRHLQHHLDHLRATPGAERDWRPTADDATAASAWLGDVGRWHALLTRLPSLLPEGARLTSVQWNPDDISGSDRRLLISGVLHTTAGQDPMARVTDFVGTVGRDSCFAARFHGVRLVSTRTRDTGEAEFQMECR